MSVAFRKLFVMAKPVSFVPQRDPAALANAIKKMLEDSKNAQKMGLAGKALVASMFDTPNNTQALCQSLFLFGKRPAKWLKKRKLALALSIDVEEEGLFSGAYPCGTPQIHNISRSFSRLVPFLIGALKRPFSARIASLRIKMPKSCWKQCGINMVLK